MLKIDNSLMKKGTKIRLPETWHDKVVRFNQDSNFPYEFFIEEIVREKKETYCICKAEKKSCKNNKLILSEDAISYLLADEVADQNIGLSFKEYLPMENSEILLTNCRNPSEVVPGIFKIDVELKDGIVGLKFIIDFINGDGFSSIKLYSSGTKKSNWKFIRNPDVSYMTEYEKMFCDTLIHKSYVKQSCEKLALYLEKEGAIEHAKQLRERAKVHDNSKICCREELHALSRIIDDKSTLKDASKQLSEIKKDAIRLHWKHNSHHPEFYKTSTDMSRLDVMEMCCDWHARSTQFNTNFLEYVKTQQKVRFHFPDWLFAEIMHYCEILDSKF